MSDALDLELKATEVAVAASKFAAAEREVQSAAKKVGRGGGVLGGWDGGGGEVLGMCLACMLGSACIRLE